MQTNGRGKVCCSRGIAHFPAISSHFPSPSTCHGRALQVWKLNSPSFLALGPAMLRVPVCPGVGWRQTHTHAWRGKHASRENRQGLGGSWKWGEGDSVRFVTFCQGLVWGQELRRCTQNLQSDDVRLTNDRRLSKALNFPTTLSAERRPKRKNGRVGDGWWYIWKRLAPLPGSWHPVLSGVKAPEKLQPDFSVEV